MILDTSENTSFSHEFPGLQLAIDSTSLGAFKECPRKYYYSIVLGLVPKELNVHLRFGLLLHKAHEHYYHSRAVGETHEQALHRAIHWMLKETWDKVLKRANFQGDNYKNRLTLLRTLVWYFDQYGDNDSIETVILANGKPAVELSFSFDSGYRSRLTGEPVLFCGHMDRIGRLNGETYILDPKTTKSDLSPFFFNQFNPHNQLSGMYPLAGQVAFGQPVKGVIVDGIQVLVNSSRFARHPIPLHQEKLQEWHRDAIWQVRLMEASAEQGYWPMNDMSCQKYGGCPFVEICSKPEASRAPWLKASFGKRIWDPLQRRGDI